MKLFVNFYGIFLGLVMLLATGAGHVIVIKGEYHYGVKIWPFFLLVGVLSLVFSLFTRNALLSGTLGILGVTFLWGILELFHQRERVRKGWFPKKR